MDVYRWICDSMYRCGSKTDYIFAHTLITLSWNLVCRANNSISICLQHITWENDSLVIYFAQSKTDQIGDHDQEPRHIFANPFQPEICPVLSLGVYLLCFPVTSESEHKLFPGSTQFNRFSKILKRFFAEPTREEYLLKKSMKPILCCFFK